MTLPILLLSLFPIYWLPLGTYGNLIIGLLVIAIWLTGKSFVDDNFVFILAVFAVYMTVGFIANILWNHNNFIHYFKYASYFFYFYLFAILDNCKKIFLLKVFIYSCLFLTVLVIIVKLLTLFGFDVSFFTAMSRWFESKTLESHPLITKEEIIYDERLAYGNPSMVSFILFLGLVSTAILFKIGHLTARRSLWVIFLFFVTIFIAFSRMFLTASLLFILFHYVSLSQTRFNKKLKVFVIVFLVLALAIAVYFKWDSFFNNAAFADWVTISFRTSQFEAPSQLSRIRMYALFFDDIEKYLIIGSGPNMFEKILEAELGFQTSPESLYLSLFSTYGVIAGVALLGIYFILFKAVVPYTPSRVVRGHRTLFIYLLLLIGFILPIDRYSFSYILIPCILSVHGEPKSETNSEATITMRGRCSLD